MKTSWLTLALLALATAMGFRSVAAANVPAHDSLSPVLVELFTSKGCSSCPPADALLTKLDGLQPIAGAQVIVLSEHVDYWNHDGWKDAYSSSLFTERQQEYVRRLGAKGPYTPEMVIDGAAEMNGSDAAAVGRAIESARTRAKVAVHVSSFSLTDPKTIHLHVVVDALPADLKSRKATFSLRLRWIMRNRMFRRARIRGATFGMLQWLRVSAKWVQLRRARILIATWRRS
jgi:hypothetical protein